MRRKKLRRELKKLGVDALLVTDVQNVTYLTGFTGDDSYLLVTKDKALMLSDSRFTTQLSEECPDIDAVIRRLNEGMGELLKRVVTKTKSKIIGFEARTVTVSLHEQLVKYLPDVKLVSTCEVVEQLRQIKDKTEIVAIRHAVQLAERAFDMLRASLRPDKTEKQVADDLEYHMRVLGAKVRGFQSIVGVGARAALPHGVPSQVCVGEDSFILIDWGACEHLYISDLTRVLITGKISQRFKRIYNVVLEAQTRAIKAIRPGATCAQIDKVARGYIADQGFGKQFGHGLGHGIGLNVHELPRLSAKSDVVLQPGMVLTIEPGIYFPGWGGVRLEDDILVTRTGHEVLSTTPKQLDEVIVDL